MVRREADDQKHTFREVQLQPKADTTYERMAARQSQEQRTRNADALARARSVAKLSKNW
jgi:hypothetical protein